LQTAISERFKRKKTDPQTHWLDYAEDKHGAQLVAETKIVAKILYLYLPLPIYWAVYMQQGSRWTFQASKMNGDLGFYTVTPDQMIALNPFFVILTLPICDYILFPIKNKISIKTLLQKMTVGGMFAVAAFITAGFLQYKIEKDFLCIFWLVPQYVILAFSENFLFTAQVNFAYTEAPASMKSVMTSFVFVEIALGNSIVVLISGTKLFESQAVEFFFFAGILFVAMISFGFLASRYKYDQEDNSSKQ
jgi:dipeptide/tripeptide permease